VNPTTGPYVIQGFWVNNPVHEDNEPHSAGDVCGSGSTHGVENQWVSYSSWQSTYFTGCAYDSADSSLQYISVCDPEEPKISVPRRREPVRYFDGRTIADKKRVPGVIRQELARLGLDGDKLTARVARGKFGAPLLVERLDVENSYYYLVPSLSGKKLNGFAQVDARYGSLDGLFTLAPGATPFETDARRVGSRLTGIRVELPNEQGRVRLDKGKFKIDRQLVWRPCRQAYSPHLPFWRIRAGAFTFYQRIDGRVFSQLTLNGRGI